MTKHPLTNEKALSLFSFERLMDRSQPITIEDAMRTAADWQLEQVIEWLKVNLMEDDHHEGYAYRYDDCSKEWLKVNLMKHDYHEGYAYLNDDCSNAEIEVDKVLEDLKQAMRPQQQEDNS